MPPKASESGGSDSHKPSSDVQAACKEGLKLVKDGKGGSGLREETESWAKHMSAGKSIDGHQARRMKAWFNRHEKSSKKPGWEDPPTPGYVAWQLWGGDAAHKWAKSICEADEKAGKKEMANGVGSPPKEEKTSRGASAKKKEGKDTSSAPVATKKKTASSTSKAKKGKGDSGKKAQQAAKAVSKKAK